MLNVTLNETEIVQEALKGKYNKNKIVVTLQLLLKYYYKNGMVDKLQLREQLLNFLKENYPKYKRAKWEELATNLVNGFLKVIKDNKIEVKLIDINEIHITKNELEYIKGLNNKNLEKIAFIMLVYAKISNKIMNNDSGWINKSITTICKEAKVSLKGIEKEKAFNELYKLKYIEQRKHNAKTNLKICYIDDKSDIEITINDFEGVVYQYLIWKGEKWKRCENEKCTKYFKPTNNKSKYCPSCAREKQLEWQRESMRKSRNVK